MGLFSYFRDAASGKIYKDNILLSDNAAKILKKVSNLPEDNFLRFFITAATASIHSCLHILILEDRGEDDTKLNIFKEKAFQLTPEKTFEAFKFFIGYYLAAFLSNKNNKELLKHFHFSEEKFKNEIFRTFNYSEEDKDIFNKLFKERQEEENASRYFLHFYKFLTKRVFGKEDENAFGSLLISESIHIAYKSFIESLEEKYYNP